MYINLPKSFRIAIRMVQIFEAKIQLSV